MVSTIVLAASLSYQTDCVAKVSRESVLAWLRYQEGLARSADVRYKCTALPTRPEMIPFVEKVSSAEKGAPSRLVTEEQARGSSFEFHFFRKGEKERDERSRPDASRAERFVNAFDGQFMRSLGTDSRGASRGAIRTAQDAHWKDFYAVHPFAFLWEFTRGKTFSAIVETAKEFDVSTVKSGDKSLCRVFVREGAGTYSWALLLDDNQCLVERDLFIRYPRQKQDKLREKHVLSEYREHLDPSGETIRFPYKMVCHYYMDELADGTPVEWTTRIYEVQEAKFNVDLPDSLFVIDFPPDAEVEDEINGFGSIREADRQALLAGVERQDVRRRRWLIFGFGPVVIVVTAIGVARWRRWKVR